MLNFTTTSIQRFNGTTLDRNMFNRIIKFLCFTYQLYIYIHYTVSLVLSSSGVSREDFIRTWSKNDDVLFCFVTVEARR